MTAVQGVAGAAVIVEWAPFRLREGLTERDLLEASNSLQADFLARQDGFLRRELLRGPDGAWADLVYWADRASADAVMQLVAESPVCQRYFSLMVAADPANPGVGVLHYQRLRAYD